MKQTKTLIFDRNKLRTKEENGLAGYILLKKVYQCLRYFLYKQKRIAKYILIVPISILTFGKGSENMAKLHKRSTKDVEK